MQPALAFQPGVITASLRVRPGCRADLLKALLHLREQILQEGVCLGLDGLASEAEPHEVLLYELWPGREFVQEVQLKKSCYMPCFERIAPLLDGRRPARRRSRATP